MSDIKASERRLAAALDRIDYLLETAAAPKRGDLGQGTAADSAPPQADAALQAQMAEVLADNQRLHSALEAMRPQLQSTHDAGDDGESYRVAELGDQAARLSSANEELVSANRGLIEALAGTNDGVEAVAVALEAEIEGLRAARAAEISQFADLMAELQRMLTESAAADAPFAADVAVAEVESRDADIVSFGDEGGVPEQSRERETTFDAVYGDEPDDPGADLDDAENGGR
ncbi:hypothetical protein [Paracoccus tegillarcae]|uniref:Uncharacterized protein n=1 Tax=Paracoccus tegillarcae TaxID=1529068 RepID=A0A2K9EHE2_9RHOB|nr:hypothetical protein [Paracoccus tegillarcae]AUH34380.1 hypothetical protein CUV01_14180 [Paracoccus tegillarcae]